MATTLKEVTTLVERQQNEITRLQNRVSTLVDEVQPICIWIDDSGCCNIYGNNNHCEDYSYGECIENDKYKQIEFAPDLPPFGLSVPIITIEQRSIKKLLNEDC